ncbi:SUMF1/EgtB/PvdO family nonheme iron enzyme [Odoribacter lunatus]|uniref:SUMF1/EgtB/PvdO family nonheme iron enzyme n=1 Tax=Odoribacter lunatus TaxID=2941335 RepID=UPI00203B206E|nr:SUMF1/EgtB/PvdO family nonheme iron enzyme [Odoribacter lunatus]
MKRVLYLLWCLVLLSGCGSDSDKANDEPDKSENPKNVTLELSRTDLAFEAAGGEKTFVVSCNGNWTLENGSGWCRTDFSKGTGNLTVTVTVDEYSGIEDRNANLTVKAGDKTQVLGVTQKGKDAIIVSKDKFEVPQEGETISVEVKSNISYEVTIPEEFESWIAPSPRSRAVTTKSYDFTVSENEVKQTRSGYIVFSGNSLYDTVWVYQAEFVEQLILTEDSYDLPAEGGEITVELKTNVNYDVEIPASAASWINRVYTRAMRTDKLHFSISENKSRDERSASITIRDRNNGVSDVLYIHQSGREVLVLSQERYLVRMSGDTIAVQVKEGVDCEVRIPTGFQSWIVSLGETSSGNYRFAVLENEDSESEGREGYIVFSGNSLTDTVYVIQLPDSFTEMVSGVKLEMVYVKGGTFMMGATSEQGSSDPWAAEYPVHSVTLSDYYIAKFEVTQGLWQVVMGKKPSSFNKGDNYPVESESWNDIQTFLTKLSQQTGKKYTLPTEAQWEYAARGGSKSKGYKYSGSSTIGDVAWYSGNSNSSTHPVGTKQSNELGIYDMSGNVWEWCQDWYGDYSSEAQTDPVGPETGSLLVLRGGSWGYDARYCRVSFRPCDFPGYRNPGTGIRLVLLP